MHRAVLLAAGDEIDGDAIMLTGAAQNDEAAPAPAASPLPPLGGATASAAAPPPLMSNPTPETDGEEASSMVGRTVADVERQLIINTLEHCLGNRTHAATILGISIRTLRNKLKAYSDAGLRVPPAGESERALV